MKLEIPEVEVSSDDVKGKGRGRPPKTVGGKGSILNASPLGAGLKDGMAVAFRFMGEEERVVEGSEDGEDEDMEVEDRGGKWVVEVPSLDDEG